MRERIEALRARFLTLPPEGKGLVISIALVACVALWWAGSDWIRGAVSSYRDRKVDERDLEYSRAIGTQQQIIDRLTGKLEANEARLEAAEARIRKQDEAIQLLAEKARVEDAKITTSRSRVEDARRGRARTAPRTGDELDRRLEELYPEAEP